MFSKPHNFSPCWNIGGSWKISTQTPQIVVSMAKIHLRHHKLWCWMQKFAFNTIKCCVEGEFLERMPPKTHFGVDGKNSPMTPKNVVSKVNILLWHHNLWCTRWIFAIDTRICGVRGGSQQLLESLRLIYIYKALC